MSRKEKITHYLLVFLLFSLFSVQVIELIYHHSLTYDEHAHVASGHVYIRNGKFPGGWLNPPFGQTLLGLPYGLGWYEYDPVSAIPPVAARVVNLLLGLLLGFGIYLFSRCLYGPWGALLSLAVYCLSPLLVAYSSIATTDMPVSVFPLFFLFFLYLSNRMNRLLLLVPAGAFLALAAACKNNALIIVVIAPFLLLTKAVIKKEKMSRLLLELFVLFFVAWFVFCSTHCFHGCFTRKPQISFAPLRLLAPILPTKAVESVASHLGVAAEGREVYLWGNFSVGGFWYYYPLLMLMKTPMGTLFLYLLCMFFLFRTSKKELFGDKLFIWLPAFLYFFLTVLINAEQVGLRHLMILHPFLFVALGVLGKKGEDSLRLRRLIFAALLVNVVSLFYARPHQMSYFNEVTWALNDTLVPVGGPDVDWGQDDKVLEEYLEKLGPEKKVTVLPFPRHVPRPGTFAVNVQASVLGPFFPFEQRYDWLQYFKPTERVGNSWFIYHIPKERLLALAQKPRDDVEAHKIFLEYHYWNGRYQEVLNHVAKLQTTSPPLRFLQAKAQILSGNYKAAEQTLSSIEKARDSLRTFGPWLKVAKALSKKKEDLYAEVFLLLHMMDRPLTDGLIHRLHSEYVRQQPNEGLVALAKAFYAIDKHDYEKALSLVNNHAKAKTRPVGDKIKALAETGLLLREATFKKLTPALKTSVVWESLKLKKGPDETWQRMLALYKKYPNNYEVIRRLNMFHMLRRGFSSFDVRYDTGANLLFDRIDIKRQLYVPNGSKALRR